MKLSSIQLLQSMCQLLLVGENSQQDLRAGIQRIYDMLEVQKNLDDIQNSPENELVHTGEFDMTDIEGINFTAEKIT